MVFRSSGYHEGPRRSLPSWSGAPSMRTETAAGALLDVNVLVALAWDSHIHHGAARGWFRAHHSDGWATCPITELGFLRVSSNPKILPAAIALESAIDVLRALRDVPGHRFFSDDISPVDADTVAVLGHRQLTDAHLLALARRHGGRLITFDGGAAALGGEDEVLLLIAER